MLYSTPEFFKNKDVLGGSEKDIKNQHVSRLVVRFVACFIKGKV